MLLKRWKIKANSIHYESTRKGWHLIIRTPKAYPLVRQVMMQSIIAGFTGGDLGRESLNALRVLAPRVPKFWKERTNILYGGKL